MLSEVNLNNWFKITSDCISFKSITILTPSLLDSSLSSEIPSIILSFATLAIFSINADFFTEYGISEIIIDSPLFDDSIDVFALIKIDPFPV